MLNFITTIFQLILLYLPILNQLYILLIDQSSAKIAIINYF